MSATKHFKLRPHHGLCIQFFQGKGYSQEFVENMQEIVSTLQKNPTIQLVSGADSVCRCCPNRVGVSDCNSQEKVTAYDNAVLHFCRLNVGDFLLWEDFRDKVIENILAKNLRKDVCGGCQWTELCQ